MAWDQAASAYEVFPAGSAPGPASRQISELGSAVVRGIWPAEPLQRLHKAISGYCDERRADVVAGRHAHPTAKMYASHGVGTLAGLIHSGHLGPTFPIELFRGSGYEQICRDYHRSERLYCQLNRCGFREHRTELSRKSFIPYHQDSYSQDERINDVLNCWTPLDPCGRGLPAPGLEVVMNRCTPNFPRKDFGLATENAAYDFITIDRGDIVAAFGDNFLAETFAVGDCLIFSQDVIHRTYVTPDMTQPRINFEFRVFSEDCISAESRAELLGATALLYPLFQA